jgi:hypothetical protein
MKSNNKKYETNDIHLASAFIANDVQLYDYSINGSVFTFIFEDREKCSQMEELWLTDKLNVPAYKFSQALRQLKNIVFGSKHVK